MPSLAWNSFWGDFIDWKMDTCPYARKLHHRDFSSFLLQVQCTLVAIISLHEKNERGKKKLSDYSHNKQFPAKSSNLQQNWLSLLPKTTSACGISVRSYILISCGCYALIPGWVTAEPGNCRNLESVTNFYSYCVSLLCSKGGTIS